MKGRSCCSTYLFTGGSILGKRRLVFKHGGHMSYGGRSRTFAAYARTLAMCRSLTAAHSPHSKTPRCVCVPTCVCVCVCVAAFAAVVLDVIVGFGVV